MGDQLKAWTDYPFTRLGDVAGRIAPIREVTLLAYDGDKYATVEVAGLIEEVKAGYLYSEPDRVDNASNIGLAVLRSLGGYP